MPRQTLTTKLDTDARPTVNALQSVKRESSDFARKNRDTTRSLRQTDRASEQLSNSLREMRGALLGIVSVGAITAGAAGITQLADGIIRASQSAGLTTDQFQEMRTIAIGLGADTEGLVDIFLDMQIKLSEARTVGNGLNEVLEQLNMDHLLDDGVNAVDVFKELVANASLAEGHISNIANQFGSTNLAKFVNLARASGLDLDALIGDAPRLTDEELSEVAATTAEFRLAIDSLKLSLADNVLPALTLLIKIISGFFHYLGVAVDWTFDKLGNITDITIDLAFSGSDLPYTSRDLDGLTERLRKLKEEEKELAEQLASNTGFSEMSAWTGTQDPDKRIIDVRKQIESLEKSIRRTEAALKLDDIIEAGPSAENAPRQISQPSLADGPLPVQKYFRQADTLAVWMNNYNNRWEKILKDNLKKPFEFDLLEVKHDPVMLRMADKIGDILGIGKVMEDVNEEASEWELRMRAVDSITDGVQFSISDGITGALTQATTAAEALNSVLLQVLNNLVSTLISDPIADFLTAGLKTFINATLSPSSASGPQHGGSVYSLRASGGPVASNVPYVVGELGPEVFVPSAPGRVNAHGAGPAAPNITVNGSHDTAKIRNVVIAMMPEIAKVSNDYTVAQSRRTGPTRQRLG